MSIKTKISKSAKRNRFDLSHDVNTTSNFGFLQPLMGRELMPDSKMSVKVNSIVRLAPMPVPTYGRVDYRIYHQFVPYSEIFAPFENVLSGQSYSSHLKSYVPQSVPTCDLYLFAAVLFSYRLGSSMTIYSITEGESVFESSVNNEYLPYSFSSLSDAEASFHNAFFESKHISRDIYKYLTPNVRQSGDDIVTLDSCDFTLLSSDGGTIYAIKLGPRAKNVRKVLLGLGYQIDFSNTSSVSLMPLFSFYKAYFDIFYPKDGINWRSTNVYKYLNVLTDHGNYDFGQLISSSYLELFLNFFFNDLSSCYYYDGADYISSHVVNTSRDTYNVLKVSSDSSMTTVTNAEHSQPVVKDAISRNVMLAVNKLTKYLNKNTVIGSSILDFMKVHFGSDVSSIEQSNFIGSDVCDIQIGDVMSLAGNPGETLGQFAGKGYGYNQGDFLTFESKQHGIWITMACIVPHGGYVQGVDYNLFHRTKFEFPTPEFDSLGFQVSNKDVVMGSQDVFALSSPSGESFGFIPRYFEAKVANNVLNGDMSLKSTRDSFLPYTLDRFITPLSLRYSFDPSDNSYRNVRFNSEDYSVPSAGSIWRNIGQYHSLQNYERIFNTGQSVYDAELFNFSFDNFIIHNYIECYLHQPLLSVSESFDTDANDEYTETVEHS